MEEAIFFFRRLYHPRKLFPACDETEWTAPFRQKPVALHSDALAIVAAVHINARVFLVRRHKASAVVPEIRRGFLVTPKRTNFSRRRRVNGCSGQFRGLPGTDGSFDGVLRIRPRGDHN